MKKKIAMLLTSCLMLTACSREVQMENTVEPVIVKKMGSKHITLEIAQITKPVCIEEPKKNPWSLDMDTDEAYILAKIAMAEAESEDTEGKALVMLVVLNRVWDDSFPDTVEEVVLQENQFSPVADGRYDKAQPDDDCWDALALVMDGWDGSGGALYFESRSTSTWHQKNLKYLFQHGKHYFYTEKEDGQP